MVIGHIGIAYMARSRWERAALPALLVGTLVPDFADLVLPQGDQCRGACGMYTHAVPAVFVLALIMAAFAWLIWHRRATALLAGSLVLAHVACDLVTGFKPLWLRGPPVGLALYVNHPADFALESLIMTAGWLLLRRRSSAPRTAVTPVMLLALISVQGIFNLLHYRSMHP